MVDVAVKAPQPGATSLSTGMRYYALILLMLVLTMNFLDRQVLSILLESIRKELSLTDTQIGLLTGTFTPINVLLSIPVARLADRWSRRKVIAAAVTVWSVMTIFCGLAQNFAQLMLTRSGVGAGQSGGSAPSQAMAGDLFPREQRATAIAILLMSQPIGYVIAFLCGGWLLEALGWRNALILAGIPGILFGLLVLFTLPEAEKGMSDGVRAPLEQPPLWATLRLLWAIKTVRYMTIASMLQSFLQLGLTQWVPTFLMRSYGMTPKQIGTGMAFAFGIGYAVGTMGGGRLIDILGRRDLRWHFWVPTIAILVASTCSVAAFSGPQEYVFVLLCAQILFGALWASSLAAIGQSLVPIAVRTTMLASLLFVINIFAIGIGPFVMGAVSDLLKASYGAESLHMTLIGAAASAFPAALFYYLASLSYRSELSAAEARNKETVANQ